MAIDTELRTEIEQVVAATLFKLISGQQAGADATLDLSNFHGPHFATLNLPNMAELVLVSEELQAAIKSGTISITDLLPTLANADAAAVAKLAAISHPNPAYIEPLVRVAARAIEVLGTSEKALRWINTPVRSLGDRTPMSLLDSPEGLTSVEDALGRIEHGVW